jgi:hypothetical protein
MVQQIITSVLDRLALGNLDDHFFTAHQLHFQLHTAEPI